MAPTHNNNSINYNQPLFKTENGFGQTDNRNDNRIHSEARGSMDGTTTEFIDCIELLNQAERKVQNRQISPKNNNLGFF
jgi:hypothetical protein